MSQASLNSSSRLAALINEQNMSHKAAQIVKAIDINEQQLKIPEILVQRVPRHWNTFLEDAEAELSQVTSKIYDGGVSKGLKHGVG